MSCRSSTACWASADRVTSPDCPSVFLQTLLRVWPVLRKTVDPVDCTPSQQRSGVVYRIPATVRCGLQDPSNGQVWSTGSQQRSGVVYRIPATVRCTIPGKSYAKVYIGQTLEPRLKEHRTALVSGEVTLSAVAQHAVDERHDKDWEGSTVSHFPLPPSGLSHLSLCLCSFITDEDPWVGVKMFD